MPLQTAARVSKDAAGALLRHAVATYARRFFRPAPLGLWLASSGLAALRNPETAGALQVAGAVLGAICSALLAYRASLHEQDARRKDDDLDRADRAEKLALARQRAKDRARLQALREEREADAEWAEKSKGLVTESLKKVRESLHEVRGQLQRAELKANEDRELYKAELARLTEEIHRLTDEVRRLERANTAGSEDRARLAADLSVTRRELVQARMELSRATRAVEKVAESGIQPSPALPPSPDPPQEPQDGVQGVPR